MPAKTRKKLPDKPSALIRLALDDLRAIERSKQYKVMMEDWHSGNTSCGNPDCTQCKRAADEPCEVCFAGSVMAKSLGADKNDCLEPDDFDGNTENKLYAINCFRTGALGSALEFLGLDKPTYLSDEVPVIEYDESPAQFKKEMSKMADALERFGL
jgi:hypothetical protein